MNHIPFHPGNRLFACFLGLCFSCLQALSYGQVCGSAKIFTYNAISAANTDLGLGATTLTLGSHAGTLGSQLSGGGPTVALNGSGLPTTGSFLGVSDGFLAFSNTNGTVDFYNAYTGIGSGTSIPTALVPAKGTTDAFFTPFDEPQSGGVVRDLGTRYTAGSGAFIDIMNDYAVYKDADGSLSAYGNTNILYNTSSPCVANLSQVKLWNDPTWTTFTLGGPLIGAPPTKANILAAEGVGGVYYLFAVGAVGDNNLYYYEFSTGWYYGSANVLYPNFTDPGGPLAGVGMRTAVTNGVTGITYLGIATNAGLDVNHVFYDGTQILTYNIYTNTRTYTGVFQGTAASLSDLYPADNSVMDHTNLGDVLGADFMGVGDIDLNFLDAKGHLEWYLAYSGNVVTNPPGGGYYETDFSTLNGPQAGAPVNNPNFADVFDNGYAYFDADGTMSWYNNGNNAVVHDANWRTFVNGPLAGVAPSRSNIIATETSSVYPGVYVLEADGSLDFYLFCDGTHFPTDFWPETTFNGGGPLDGKDISDAVQNLTPGVTYLGISNGEMVFAVCLAPMVTTTKKVVSTTANGDGTYNVIYEVGMMNTGASQVSNLQVMDDVATQLGCAFVSVVSPALLSDYSLVPFPATPPSNLSFNGGTNANLFPQPNLGLLQPTAWMKWRFTVKVDPGCAAQPLPLNNQATGSGSTAGNDLATDLSDDGDSFSGTNPTFPGETGGTNDPTPLLIPETAITKGIISATPDPSNPSYHLVVFELKQTNTGSSPMTNLMLTDNLAGQLGCAFINLAASPAITASSATTPPTTNAGFNGNGNINIFTGAPSLLAPGQMVTVRFTVRMDANCGAMLSNLANGGGTAPNFAGTPTPVTAPSTPASGGTGATAISIPAISTVKRVVGTDAAACPAVPGLVNATYEIGIKNVGNVNLTDLAITDDLVSQLGCAFVGVAGVPTIFASTATTNPSINNGYAGTGSLFIPSPGLLAPGQYIFVHVTVTLDKLCGQPEPLLNQATGSGNGPAGPISMVSDLSDTGPDDFGAACAGVQIFTYNEFTGFSSFTGATALTGGGTFANTGALGAALGNGNFLGVEDGELMFFDPVNKTVEQYNWLTGGAVYENIPATLLPTNGVTASLNDEPHSGEPIRNNPNFIDVGDDDLVYKDADGSLSSYYNLYLTGTCPNGGQGYLLSDPTWTAYIGGPLTGQAPTNANILAIEDGLIYTLGAAGDNNYHYYFYANGIYGGISNFGYPTFTGGPLNGATPRAAMTNSVPTIVFLGGNNFELTFFQTTTNTIYSYNRNNLFQTYAGFMATALSDPFPADAYIYNHTSVADILGTDFMGTGDAEVLLLDATGHLEWFNIFTPTGPGVYEADMSILRGPQGGNLVNNAGYIDAVDDGYVFLDADGTISWYNEVTNTVYHDANWRQFMGGPLNGQAPSSTNIIAGEDAGVYALESNGTLFYYNICDGKPWPGGDLWTATTLTNGPLNGKTLSSAVSNQVPGVQFLGIAGDELVFAVCPVPVITAFESNNPGQPGDTGGQDDPTQLSIINVPTIPPVAPPAGAVAQNFCTSPVPTIASLVAVGSDVMWYATATGGAALPSTTPLANGTTYYAGQTVGACESPIRLAVVVTVNPTPAAPSGASPQTFCSVTAPTLNSLAVTGTNIKWFDAATGGNYLPPLTPLVNGVTYHASQTTASGCESVSRLAITAIVNTTPNAPTGLAAQFFCTAANPTVASLTASGTAVQWYNVATFGSPIPASTPLVSGAIYYASQTETGCESVNRLAVTATIYANPSAPTGAAVQSFCSVNSPTIASLVVTGANIQWYATASGGGPLATSTPLVNGATYFATQTVNGCESTTRLSVTVFVVLPPPPPTGAAAQSFCVANNPTIASLLSAGSGVQWYAAATGGSPLANSTPLVNGATYYAGQTVSGCESIVRFAVTVAINPSPAAPTGAASQIFCAGNTAYVANLAATGTAIQWYAAPTGGSPLLPSTVLVSGTHYYASQTVGGCESAARLDVTVTINTAPAAPAAVSPQVFCGTPTPTVANLAATGTAIQWFVFANGGTALPTSTPLMNGAGYYASQTVNGCPSPRTFVAVTIRPTPPVPTGPAAQGFCQSGSPTVASLTAYGTGIQWFDMASGGNLLAPGTALVNGMHYYASQTVNGCGSATRLDVTATLNPSPAPPTGLSAQTFCNGNNPTLASIAVTGTGIQWYASATGGAALPNYTQVIGGGHYFARQTVSGCESASFEVTATVNASPSQPVAFSTQIFCIGDNPTVASLDATGTAIQWFAAPTGGSALPTSTPLVNGATYYAAQTVGGCTCAMRTAVTVIVKTPLPGHLCIRGCD